MLLFVSMSCLLGQKNQNKIVLFQLFPTMTVQHRQHADATGCHTFFGRLSSMFVFDVLQIPSGYSPLVCIKDIVFHSLYITVTDSYSAST